MQFGIKGKQEQEFWPLMMILEEIHIIGQCIKLPSKNEAAEIEAFQVAINYALQCAARAVCVKEDAKFVIQALLHTQMTACVCKKQGNFDAFTNFRVYFSSQREKKKVVKNAY